MSSDLLEALTSIEKEKGVSKDIILEALKDALVSAYKRNFHQSQNVSVHINDDTGDIEVYARKEVVEDITDEQQEISLQAAQAINTQYDIGDIVEIEVTPEDFGRIAAQTAKQIVTQRVREAERGIVYSEFIDREDDVMTGIVQRQDHRFIYVDLGRLEALLPAGEQMPTESYQPHDRIKVYITNVERTTKGPQVMVSRTHPGLLKRLFELEVPEISDGTVEVRSISREAGDRSKISVFAEDPDIDPVGSCVGQNGGRVQTIVDELKGEKIDIVHWSEDPVTYIANALSPSKVIRVIVDEDNQMTEVIVPDYQLSLAIGKRGQNARLAAKLTGWKIDIKSESEAEEEGLFEHENAAIPLTEEDDLAEDDVWDEEEDEYDDDEAFWPEDEEETDMVSDEDDIPWSDEEDEPEQER